MTALAPAVHSTFLPGQDRCDRCGAAAAVRVMVLASRLPLLFCAHHYTGQADAISRVAVVTHDDRAVLTVPRPMLEVA